LRGSVSGFAIHEGIQSQGWDREVVVVTGAWRAGPFIFVFKAAAIFFKI